ncbi:TFIIH/NER complex ATP-dependent 5'-3' DNA helicase subunit RAD3 [Sporobolomyces salmoneus]|uniref:TFIIH/NER complex ATP-dependent 5'-3' DNA helicase subunit RAD3 n=1 Tax=Sporobolomyces salmoneus TaxID=183962 RepID=UPI00316E8CC9
MRFFIDSMEFIFPYDKMYPEQYAYVCDLKRSLDAKGHCVLEMPSGTGKTVSLLSLIVAYQYHERKEGRPERKLIYCSRTVPEIEKALAELKRLMQYRKEVYDLDDGDFLGIGLSSRKNLCIHPQVRHEKKGKAVDARCRDMTNSVAKEKWTQDPESVELCSFHENLGELDQDHLIPYGVHTIDDIKRYGQEHGICPYFAIRRMFMHASVVIYSFHYLLDPKVAEQVSKHMSKDSIVVFDEAHNIDNVCIESLSIDLTRPMLDTAARSIDTLSAKIEEIKANDAERLEDEYRKLVEGLQGGGGGGDDEEDEAAARNGIEDEDFMANPVLPAELLAEAIPGNIRRAEHFTAFLSRFVEYLKTRMRVLHVVAETPLSFLQHLKDITFIDRKPLKFCAERLSSLVRTLQLTRIDEYSALQKVAAFATLVSTYHEGFRLLLEPFETDNATVPNPVFHLVCLDASLAIAPVFERFSSVVITSGTLSPLDMYPRMLGFEATVLESYVMTLTRDCFLPLVVTRGSDQVEISSRFEVRNDPAVVRNFGTLLVEYCKAVPDGVVAFFPSYLYMESIVSAWNEMGILNEVLKHKLIFIETPDAIETSAALENYRRACDNGRGACLLSVARGKVSEGIDFDHNYGRAVIMFGIPYQYTESRILKARLEFLRDTYRIRENDFLTFDAMRHAAQCVGRVLRGKTDYGLMIFADKRFAKVDKRNKLPKWIGQYIKESDTNLATDVAIAHSKRFLRMMAQPFEQSSKSLWGVEEIEEKQRGLDPERDGDGDGDEPQGGPEDEEQQPPPEAEEDYGENGFDAMDQEMLAQMDVDDMTLPTPPPISAH